MKTKRCVAAVLFSAIAACLVSAGCSARRPVEKTWLTMGTFATLTIPCPATRKQAEECFDAASSIVGEVDNTMSLFKPDSDTSRLNSAAGNGMIPIAEHTRRTLELSLRYSQLSGGAFDSTVAPLVNLWGFNWNATPESPPAPEAVRNALRTVGFTNVAVSNSMAALTVPGMKIDFGGIAKGYAVDRCFEELARRGIENFMMNIGGNLRVHGKSRPERSWNIGVRDPFDSGNIMGTVLLPSGMALATSGNYERFVTIEGRRYAHIIDPRTGMPVEGMAGVTVLCPSAAQADAMSTALFVLGPEEASTVLASTPECHAILVPDTKPMTVIVTRGMMRYFTPLPFLSDRVREMKREGSK